MVNDMLCNEKDILVYKKIYDAFNSGLVLEYDDNLKMNLCTHKNKNLKDMNSYMSDLCSNKSIGRDTIYSRYLMLFLDSEEYKIYDGHLDCFTGNFKHSWIENEMYVYDTSFIGKWPKELYYEIFFPVKEKEIDLSRDKEYQFLKKDNISVDKEIIEMQYHDWYSYMKNNTISTRALSEPLMLKKYYHG